METKVRNGQEELTDAEFTSDGKCAKDASVWCFIVLLFTEILYVV